MQRHIAQASAVVRAPACKAPAGCCGMVCAIRCMVRALLHVLSAGTPSRIGHNSFAAFSCLAAR
ncbi:hypothetical protein SVAN01_11304 [Stagonosporopsis vannaccii]|nr:hypothetical protein SVAN01_11304 [Stagonosporopsis vannaccii]